MTERIAILGGSSHIAKNLIPRFAAGDAELALFCRSAAKLAGFAPAHRPNVRLIDGFDSFNTSRFDLVINCVGAGTPGELAGNYRLWFSVLEEFDNLALNYLRTVNPAALYVTFSSGAVYGRGRTAAVTDDTARQLCPNRIEVPDYYALAKLYSEAKHRASPDLRIVDLRIFSFFSRYAALDSGYFMTDLARALAERRTLATTRADMVRDYPHPDDLAALIRGCAALPELNIALDAVSAKPISKRETLEFFAAEFGLNYEYTDAGTPVSPNATSNVYCSASGRAAGVTGVAPKRTSRETLAEEMAALLNDKENIDVRT